MVSHGKARKHEHEHEREHDEGPNFSFIRDVSAGRQIHMLGTDGGALGDNGIRHERPREPTAYLPVVSAWFEELTAIPRQSEVFEKRF